MKYSQISPPAHLANHVRYFWTLESHEVNASTRTFRPIADGCPGLIFQPNFVDHTSKTLPDIFLYGQTTSEIILSQSGNFNTVGVCFYPNALKALYGLNAHELTDTCLDFRLLPTRINASIADKLQNATTAAARLSLLSAHIASLIHSNKPHADNVMQHALSRIMHANGFISLKQLQKDLQITARSFERKFKQEVGISAKLFSRIWRFQTSLQQLKNNDFQKLSDIAYENDYADQSHFIRAFKEFAGCTPNQFQKQAPSPVENFTML